MEGHMPLQTPIIDSLPTPRDIRHMLGDALREVELLRALLKIAERAERYRKIDSKVGTKGECK
jgi:hypothetical protein